MNVRRTANSDLENISKVIKGAFGGDDEFSLVCSLLKDPTARPLLSLAAFQDNQITGHILFTKIHFELEANLSSMILAPLSVAPSFQNQGIGAMLVKRGLQILRESNYRLVFVLGYPNYYSRFGFQPAGKLGYEAPFPILEKNASAWMVLELHPPNHAKGKQRVVCADSLNKKEYWVE